MCPTRGSRASWKGFQENVEVFRASPGCAVLGLRLHNGRVSDALCEIRKEQLASAEASSPWRRKIEMYHEVALGGFQLRTGHS